MCQPFFLESSANERYQEILREVEEDRLARIVASRETTGPRPPGVLRSVVAFPRSLAHRRQFAPSLGDDLRSALALAASIVELLARLRPRGHRAVKSFDEELQAAGGLASRVDAGARIVPVEKVVGSVSRWQNLRSDFFYRTGTAMTARFRRVGEAMREGKPLPPIEVYQLKKSAQPGQAPPPTEYYVVDGHHRVAMARKLGQDFLDAHVVAYKVGATKPDSEE